MGHNCACGCVCGRKTVRIHSRTQDLAQCGPADGMAVVGMLLFSGTDDTLNLSLENVLIPARRNEVSPNRIADGC